MLLVQTLNALQYSMLLFMLAVGLSIVLGLMNFANMAHGTLYMIGAFVGFSTVGTTGSFWLGCLAGPAAAAMLGAIFYFTILQRIQNESPLVQVLVTFGLILVGLDLVRMVWGDIPKSITSPPLLSGSVKILGETYPTYRLFICSLGVSLFALLYLCLERTRIGAVIRAGVDDKVMTSALGINVDLAFFVVFCLGCALAGLAGVAAAPLLQIHPGMDMDIIIPTLIVVVIGGPGSLTGAFFGSMVIGFTETFGAVFLPSVSSFVIYVLLAGVLLLRPEGLMAGRYSR